jgi:Pyruvate/2-oxoacid:ferredoxin oxidoreductase delta subunit
MDSMDVYERLAFKLDNLPNGYPRTETGEEIKILRMIFHPEEAEVFIKMFQVPESAVAIAERVGKPVEEMEFFLPRMVRRGQIGMIRSANGERLYYVLPFIVGVYEGQRNVLDSDLAEAGEKYIHTFMTALGQVTPPIGQIMPVGVDVPAETKNQSSNDIRKMINEAVAFNIKDCICRKGRRVLGHECNHLTKDGKPVGCLAISKDPNAFSGPSAAVLGKNVSKEEALKVLDDAEAQGLVHCTLNVSNYNTVPICNCCDCCCDILHAVKAFDVPQLLAKSDLMAQIDQGSCTACGVCKDERCPMDAIAEDKGCYTVIGERCIGCGVCTITCPTAAISIEKKDSDEKVATHMQWMEARAKNRGKEFPA